MGGRAFVREGLEGDTLENLRKVVNSNDILFMDVDVDFEGDDVKFLASPDYKKCKRPETNEEYDGRICEMKKRWFEELVRERTAKKKSEESERALYEKLKKKYETK